MDGAPLQSAASRSIRNAQAANFDNAMFYMNDHSVRKWEAVTTDIPGESVAERPSSMQLVLGYYDSSRVGYRSSSRKRQATGKEPAKDIHGAKGFDPENHGPMDPLTRRRRVAASAWQLAGKRSFGITARCWANSAETV
jgi:hypothetical protein